jgi:hypothetical protein
LRILSTIVIAGLLTASPAMAQKAADPAAKTTNAPEPETPVTESDVSAVDVAATPLTDLNIRKGEIPALLLTAQERPYDLTALNRCSSLVANVANLDRILGEDIDITDPDGSTSAGKLAQSALRAFIPFGGLIREVSGANSQDRKLQLAIRAGMVRRSFLKGVGLQRGCAYPGRPATPQIVASKLAAIAAADPKDKDKAQAAAVAAQEAKPKARVIRKKATRTRRR